jgi:hypothetical protein
MEIIIISFELKITKPYISLSLPPNGTLNPGSHSHKNYFHVYMTHYSVVSDVSPNKTCTNAQENCRNNMKTNGADLQH